MKNHRRGWTLLEVMIYVVMLSAFAMIGSTVYHRAASQSVELQLQARDIQRVMHAGERWRADVRRAVQPPEWMEHRRLTGKLMRLTMPEGGTVEYFLQEKTLWRHDSEGARERVLTKVQSSQMLAAARGGVQSVRWELALAPFRKHQQTKPLFTFQAVPGKP